MIQKNIKLNSIEDVKDFVVAGMNVPFDIDVRIDRYVVDAKSLMGVFSLDLSKPVMLTVCQKEMSQAVKDYFIAIEQFIIE